MLIEIKVPALAESVADATLVNWLKRPGDEVKQGENLIEIETDKVMLEVSSPEDGVLKEIIKDDNATVLSDEVIAVIDTEGLPSSARAEEAISRVESGSEVKTKEPSSVIEFATPKLSPAVRKLLDEHRLKPSDITTASKAGRITKEDVLNYLEAQKAPIASKESEPAPRDTAKPTSQAEVTRLPSEVSNRSERRVPMSRLRRRVAERLLAAQRENAILTTFNEANMQPILTLRKRYRDTFEEVHGVRLGFMSFFVMAAVVALKRFPAINASIDGDDIVYHDYFDIGIAVSSPRGLVVPILRNAERLNMAEMESYIAEFARKAKHNELTIEELTGGTFTITNGGVFGSLLSTPILNPPQSAILGMHKTQERPVAENGQVVIRPMMYLALSYDHRIIDGREAVQFLVTLKEQIEDPTRLLLQI